MIYLHTLGDSLIKVGEKEIRPTSPLLFAALLYLGIERGRRVPRAALQELLFPNTDERSGAHSLRQLLYKLRQLGVPIQVMGGGVELSSDQVADDCSLDLTSGNYDPARIEKLTLGFLPEYQPQLSARYSQWLDHKRATTGASIRRHLVNAMMEMREAMNWSAVEQFAHSVLQIDPFNEEATLALAEATALSGSKVKAINILEQFEAETGRPDLTISASLLRRRISASISETVHIGPEMPFLGREADCEAVRRQMLHAMKGKPSLLVIAGEPGIGKTRLLEESAALAALDGILVRVVRCHPHYASRPLGVFIELVPTLLSCRGALGVSPQTLAVLQLLVSHADDTHSRPADVRDDTTRSGVLLAALRDLVDAVSSEVPLLIAVEDVHWADPDSLRELSALVQGAEGRNLTMVFTTRHVEQLSATSSITDATIIRRLKPLGEGPMVALAHKLLPSSGGRDSLEEIVTWSVKTAVGNPLFLRMLCAHYAQTQQPFAVPPDLVSATSRRIERLPGECRRILEFCALLGRHSTIETLCELVERTPAQMVDAVRLLEEEGYLHNEAGTVRLSHDLVSECSLAMVPPLTRRLLHGCVAASLERRYDVSHDASLLWDCAEQWSLSGDSKKAVQFLIRCARHVAQIGRAAQALALLERGKELIQNPADMAELLGEVMLTAKAAGQWPQLYEASQQLALIPAAIGRTAEHSTQELLTIEALWAMQFAAPTDRLLRCIAATTASDGHRMEAAVLLLRMAHEVDDSDLAKRAYCAVESLLDEHSTSYSNRIIPLIYHVSFGDLDRGLSVARTLARELDSFESVADQYRAAINVAVALGYVGFIDDSLAIAIKYSHLTASGANQWHHEFCSYACAVLLLVERFEEAASWHQWAEIALDPSDALTATRTHACNAFELALWTRDTSLVRERLRALDKRGVGDSTRTKAFLHGAELRVLQMDPRYICDDVTLDEISRLHRTARHLGCADGLTLALGEAMLRRGMSQKARELLDEYCQHSRRERYSIPPSLLVLRRRCADSSINVTSASNSAPSPQLSTTTV